MNLPKLMPAIIIGTLAVAAVVFVVHLQLIQGSFVCIRSASDLRVLHKIRVQKEVQNLCFSPDDRKLVCSSDGADVLQVIDVRTGYIDWLERVGGVLACAVTADGKTVLTADRSGIIRAYGLTNGRPVWGIPPAVGEVYRAAFSGDSRVCALLSRNGAQVMDLTSGKMTSRIPVTDPTSVALDYRGRLLAITAENQSGRLWRVTDAKALSMFCSGSEGSHAAAFSLDGRSLAISFYNKAGYEAVRVVRLRKGGVSRDLGAVAGVGVHQLAISPRGDRLLTTGYPAQLWSLGVVKRRIVTYGRVRVNAVAYSHNGRLIATGEYCELH